MAYSFPAIENSRTLLSFTKEFEHLRNFKYYLPISPQWEICDYSNQFYVHVAIFASHQGPDGYPRKADLEKVSPGTYRASFLPDDCGKYKVGVKYNGEDLPNSPFPVQAFATGKVRVYGPHECFPPLAFWKWN